MTSAYEIQPPVRGFLARLDFGETTFVEFQYNPAQVTDKRAVTYATLNAPGLVLPVRQYTQGGDRTISFTVRVDGYFRPADNEVRRPGIVAVVNRSSRLERDQLMGIEPELNKYRSFLYPVIAGADGAEKWKGAGTSFASLYSERSQFAAPPLCRFGMGAQRVITCVVTEVGITELLFNRQLKPLRADVAITLVEIAPYGP